MTQELVQIDHTELAIPPYSIGIEEYRRALVEASEKARALSEVIEACRDDEGKPILYAMIANKKYLTFEAWQTIGKGYGMTAKPEWTKELEGGGFQARAVAIDINGIERSAAQASAGRPDDKPWNTRPQYQQESMAQTRAMSKALRSCLSWVVVLAGYAPTPAEEMPREADMIQNSEQPSQPKQRVVTEQVPAKTGNECPLHPGAFFEFKEGFKEGDPDEWRHKNGLWPDDHINKNIAGKNKWCRTTDEDVMNATAQAPTQATLVEEEKRDDHLF